MTAGVHAGDVVRPVGAAPGVVGSPDGGFDLPAERGNDGAGGGVVSGQTVRIYPGGRLLLAGDVVEVVEFDGLQATVRNERTGEFTALPLGRLAAAAKPLESDCSGDGIGGGDAGLVMAGLPSVQLAQLRERAGHVRAVQGHPTAGRGPGRGCGAGALAQYGV